MNFFAIFCCGSARGTLPNWKLGFNVSLWTNLSNKSHFQFGKVPRTEILKLSYVYILKFYSIHHSAAVAQLVERSSLILSRRSWVRVRPEAVRFFYFFFFLPFFLFSLFSFKLWSNSIEYLAFGYRYHFGACFEFMEGPCCNMEIVHIWSHVAKVKMCLRIDRFFQFYILQLFVYNLNRISAYLIGSNMHRLKSQNVKWNTLYIVLKSEFLHRRQVWTSVSPADAKSSKDSRSVHSVEARADVHDQIWQLREPGFTFQVHDSWQLLMIHGNIPQASRSRPLNENADINWFKTIASGRANSVESCNCLRSPYRITETTAEENSEKSEFDLKSWKN